MRTALLLSLFIPFFGLCQEKKVDSSAINTVVRNIDRSGKGNDKSYTRISVVNHKKVREHWKYFENKQVARLMIDYTIDTTEYSVAYTEKYYFRNGSLIYAYEREIFFSPKEGIDKGTTWAGDFYFSKGKLIDHVTLGHGKSEDDNWDPEKDILMQLKKRKAQLALLK